jgi:ketosteroid isomerase-like protein
MNDTEVANIALIRAYLDALSRDECGDQLAGFFAEDVLQVEFPNQLNPKGGESDLTAVLARSIEGQRILRSQHFEIRSEIARDERVAVEATWTGVLAVDVGSLRAGMSMKAEFAMFFEIKDGKIRRQHNYDCFEPW